MSNALRKIKRDKAKQTINDFCPRRKKCQEFGASITDCQNCDYYADLQAAERRWMEMFAPRRGKSWV